MHLSLIARSEKCVLIQMKSNIHPDYKKTTIACACGAIFEAGSVKENLRVEVCSKCHPFYIGQATTRTVEKGGQVEKFKKRYNL